MENNEALILSALEIAIANNEALLDDTSIENWEDVAEETRNFILLWESLSKSEWIPINSEKNYKYYV